jgi:hypothetical protein
MGGIDYLTNKEIGLYKGDLDAIKASLQAQQVILANSLKNGIGDDIINTLNEQSCCQKEVKKKSWFNWWKK